MEASFICTVEINGFGALFFLVKGRATARVDLLLYRTLEWKIASFFRAIGQKKLGEKVSMDWNKVLGARGRAHEKMSDFLSKMR